MLRPSIDPVRLSAALLFAAAAGWGLAGCGGTECGDQTAEQDGTCVPETQVICGEGTVPEDGECVLGDDGCGSETTLQDGQCVPAEGIGPCGPGSMFDSEAGHCVPAAAACGTNTSLNDEGVCTPDLEAICSGMGAVAPSEDGNTCVVDTGACGEGTMLSANGDCVPADGACGEGLALGDNGQCQPTAEVCDDGTEFVEDQGLCLPEATCQENDVILEGKCVSPAEELAADPDVEESENNDPEYGGEANSLTVKDPGETTSFTGTIEAPRDLNDDDSPEQDVDTFSFEADAGQWFELAVQPLGDASLYFVVTGPEDFERRTGISNQTAPIRQLALPHDGTYEVEVMPRSSAAIFGDLFGPEGGEDWNYVGSLEQLDAPDPTTVDLTQNNITGDFVTLTDNLFEVGGFSGGQVVEFTVSQSGQDVTTIGQLGEIPAGFIGRWADSTTPTDTTEIDSFDGSRVIVPSGSSSSAPLLLFDWLTFNGPRTNFEVEASPVTVDQQLGSLSADSEETTNTVSLPSSSDTALFTFSIPQGQAVEITQQNASTAEVDATLFDAQGSELAFELGMVPTNSSEDPPDYLYHYSESGGTVALEAEADEDNTDDLQFTIRTFEPTDLGSGQPGDDPLTNTGADTLGPNQSALYTLTLSQEAALETTVTPNSESNFEVGLRNADFERVGDEPAEATGSTEFTTTIYDTDGSGLKVLQITAGEEIASHDVEVAFQPPPVTDEEPNNSRSTAQSGSLGRLHIGEAGASNPDFYEFQPSSALSPGEVIYVHPPSATPFALTCELQDSQGQTLDSVSEREGGCVLATDEVSSGPFYLKINGTFEGYQDPYRFQVSRVPGASSSDGNSDQGNADAVGYDTLTADDGHYYGRITDNDTSDWFSFDVPSGGLDSNQSLKLIPEFTGLEPASRDELSTTLIDASGQSDSTLDSQPFSGVVSGDGLGAQTYYVHVQETSEGLGGQGDYRLGAEVVRSFSTTVSGGSFSDDSGNTASSQITPSACSGSSVTDVAVEANIDHPVEEEVKLVLEAPDGTSVPLQNSSGSSFSAFPKPVAYPWTAEPAGDLSNLSGKSGTSAWTLTASDTASGNSDNGTLNSWTLNFKCN